MRMGIDLIYLPRVEELAQHPAALERTFHARERSNASIERLAGILAAKEAFFKAIGITPQWLEIEVQHTAEGVPFLLVSPALQKTAEKITLSISHEHEYAVACVVIE